MHFTLPLDRITVFLLQATSRLPKVEAVRKRVKEGEKDVMARI